MIVMPRVDSDGRATAVANGHYPKKLISISRQDCAAGAHTCVPGMTIKAAQAKQARLGGHRSLMASEGSPPLLEHLRLGVSSRGSSLNLYGCDLSPCTTFSGVGL
jgi:hypothetical protein